MWELYSFKNNNRVSMERILGEEPEYMIVKRDENGKIITGYLLNEDVKKVKGFLEAENVVYCGTMKTI